MKKSRISIVFTIMSHVTLYSLHITLVFNQNALIQRNNNNMSTVIHNNGIATYNTTHLNTYAHCTTKLRKFQFVRLQNLNFLIGHDYRSTKVSYKCMAYVRIHKAI